MEQAFVEGGGYRETLAAARIAKRTQDQTDPSNPTDLTKCPDCGKPMSVRTAKTGKNQGSQFWGCSAYPACKKTMPIK